VPGAGNAIVPGDASGNRMILVPDWTANLSVNYTAPLFGGELATNVSYAYNDGFFWAADNRVRQDSVSLFNAQMMWTSPSGTYDVRIFGRNLFNEKYLIAVNENNTGDIGTPAPGRSYGVSFGVHF
jgi:iron complex outermembrane receptor protein